MGRATLQGTKGTAANTCCRLWFEKTCAVHDASPIESLYQVFSKGQILKYQHVICTISGHLCIRPRFLLSNSIRFSTPNSIPYNASLPLTILLTNAPVSVLMLDPTHLVSIFMQSITARCACRFASLAFPKKPSQRHKNKFRAQHLD